jgi:hypothetical protein
LIPFPIEGAGALIPGGADVGGAPPEEGIGGEFIDVDCGELDTGGVLSLFNPMTGIEFIVGDPMDVDII